MIYLHQTKAERSYFGGKIDSYRATETDNPHRRRIVFRFTFMPQGKGAKWPAAALSYARTLRHAPR
jgi:hypothetical protein